MKGKYWRINLRVCLPGTIHEWVLKTTYTVIAPFNWNNKRVLDEMTKVDGVMEVYDCFECDESSVVSHDFIKELRDRLLIQLV